MSDHVGTFNTDKLSITHMRRLNNYTASACHQKYM